MTRILGVDQSLQHTGLFWFDGRKLEGKEMGDAQIDTGPLRGGERLAYIRDKVEVALDWLQPNLVVMEGYSYNSPGRAFELGEIGGVLKALFFDRGCKLITPAPQQVCKYVTGNGGLKGDIKKKATIAAVNKLLSLNYDFENGDDNKADACAMAILGRDYFLEVDPEFRHQAEVLLELRGKGPTKKPKRKYQKKFPKI